MHGARTIQKSTLPLVVAVFDPTTPIRRQLGASVMKPDVEMLRVEVSATATD